MADYVHCAPITVRRHERFVLTCDGQVWRLNGRHATYYSAAEILSNTRHNMRQKACSVIPRIESGELAGLIWGELDGEYATIVVSVADYAAVADEIARFEAAQAEAVSAERARRAAERAYDAGYNEGGEGYNPHRRGSAPTGRAR